MGAPTKKIKRFMENCLAHESEIDLVLYHVNVAGRRATVWQSRGKWTIDETAILITEAAQGHADGLSNTSRFTLSAYPADDEDRGSPINHTSFTLAPQVTNESDEDGLSEPATAQGMLALLMRHNSELHRQSSGTFGMMFQYMTGIIERQSNQLETLTNEKMKHAEVMEDLMNKKHDRELESKDRESRQKRTDELFGKVLSLLPIVANKLAGKELVRQNDTLFELTSSEFVSSLKPSQLNGMLESGIIDKHQLVMLSAMLEQANARMMTIEERKQGAEKADKAATGGLGTLGMLSGLLSIGK